MQRSSRGPGCECRAGGACEPTGGACGRLGGDRSEGFLAEGGDFSEERPIPGAKALRAEFDEPWSDDLDFAPLGDVDQFGERAGYINGFPVRRSMEDGRVWITRCTGVIGLGRYNDPNTANAHFWIALQPIRANDRQDTVFGRVVWGMEHVSTMARTGPELGDESRWTPILSVRLPTTCHQGSVPRSR